MRRIATPRRIALALLLVVTPAGAVTRDEVLERAQAWVDAGVPYSYSAWYTDPTTGICCYRTDCSGFVSAVWGLSAPGHTTYSFAGGPWDDGASYEISSSELLPGDALNYPGDPDAGTGHIMLYVSGTFSSGWVQVYEEYSSGADATLRWRAIDTSLYLPIRYTGIEDCSADEVCDGEDNDCDGEVDENAVPETCNGRDDDCDGDADEDWICEQEDDAARAAWRADLSTSSDLDGDGRADVCMRGSAGLDCYLSKKDGFQRLSRLEALSDAQGFNEADNYTTLRLADVTGDGRADVCARHDTEGFRCWPSIDGGFGDALPGPELTDAAGWSDPSNYATLRMPDLDGDARADLCLRADAGLRCWLSTGEGFSSSISGPELTSALGWDQEMYYSTLHFADHDGDGRSDLCARSSAGMECWLFDGAAFSTHFDGPELSNEQGWDEPRFYLTLASPDLDGDGRADLCARAAAGIRCWRSNGAGFDGIFSGPELSDELGWDAYPYWSSLRWADVNADGRDDLCGRASSGLYCWPSNGAGFDARLSGPVLSNELGWLDPVNFLTIETADLNADGRADLCARADAGLLCWISSGTGFAEERSGPEWSDSLGWDIEQYFATFRFGGGAVMTDDTGDDTGSDTGDDTGDDTDGEPDDDTDDPTRDTGERPFDPKIRQVGSGDCGCATRPSSGSGALLLLLLAPLLARGRRQC